jgi:glycosyltransferase involved in cell wall biosynthesis
MKITLVFNEPPFPPIHGGRVDVWRRMLAFARAGVQLQLICWASDRPGEQPTAEHISRIKTVAQSCHVFPIRRSFAARVGRLWRLRRWPSHVASRVLTRHEFSTTENAVRDFGPNVIWLDALYGGVLARELATRLAVPFAYRSHNVEHEYMRTQVKATQSRRDRIVWGLNLLGLRNFEFETIAASSVFFDISTIDLEYWVRQGFLHGHWLPPFVDEEFERKLADTSPNSAQFDVGYVGNLYSPNNTTGVLWFIDHVLPLLLEKRRDIRVVIAGARPIDAVRNHCEKFPCISFIANPEDATVILGNARVLINPVFSGSGVNVKSIDMLFTNSALVSTPQGVVGLPESVRRCFSIEVEARGFASAIIDQLRTFGAIDNARREARREFSFSGIDPVLARLATLTSSRH